LRTAVQTEELPSLGRVRNAEKALALLSPLIEQAQGRLTPEELQAGAAQWQLEPPPPPPARNLKLKHYEGRMHSILFSLLLGSAILNTLDFLYDHPVIEALDIFLFVVIFAVAFATAVVQNNTDIPTGAKRLVWATLMYIGLTLYLGYMSFVFVDAIRQASSKQPRPAFTGPPETEFIHCVSLPHVDVLQIVGSLALALPGLALLNRFRQDYAMWRQPEAAPVPVSQAANDTEPDPTTLP
jgi:hypothetical protein